MQQKKRQKRNLLQYNVPKVIFHMYHSNPMEAIGEMKAEVSEDGYDIQSELSTLLLHS